MWNKTNCIWNSNNSNTFHDTKCDWIYSVSGFFPVHFLRLSQPLKFQDPQWSVNLSEPHFLSNYKLAPLAPSASLMDSSTLWNTIFHHFNSNLNLSRVSDHTPNCHLMSLLWNLTPISSASYAKLSFRSFLLNLLLPQDFHLIKRQLPTF